MVDQSKALRRGKKMKRNEFVEWLYKAGYKVDDTIDGMRMFSKGWRTVKVYEDNSVEVVFCSPCEYSVYDTCIDCFELDKIGNLVVRVWVYGDDGEVEEEHYLYRY